MKFRNKILVIILIIWLVKLGTPLPGYTGHMRRIEASNLFG